MNPTVRPLIGLCFKLMAFLALIVGFVFFMNMQDEQSLVDRYRTEGTVSKAVVSDKQVDTLVYESRRGRTREQEWVQLWVRFDPESKVKYADFPATVAEADLPAAPALTGDPVADSQGAEIIEVPRDVYDAHEVGDQLIVVDTIYSSDGPLFIEEIRDFDPSESYPWIGLSLALMVIFGLIGWRIGRPVKPAIAA